MFSEMWPPEILLKGQTPLRIDRNALGDEHLPLNPVRASTTEGHRDATSGVDNAMPGNLRR